MRGWWYEIIYDQDQFCGNEKRCRACGMHIIGERVEVWLDHALMDEKMLDLYGDASVTHTDCR